MSRQIPRLIIPALVALLVSGPAWGETVKFEDLVVRDGIHYKKFTDVTFSGKTTGNTQGTFRHGKKHGTWVFYYENGQLWSKGTYKDGKDEGPWVHYRENGQISHKGTWKNSKREGPWVGYHKDGTVWEKLTGTYKDGKKVK